MIIEKYMVLIILTYFISHCDVVYYKLAAYIDRPPIIIKR